MAASIVPSFCGGEVYPGRIGSMYELRGFLREFTVLMVVNRNLYQIIGKNKLG